MVGGDVSVTSLLDKINTINSYDAKDKSSTEIDRLADTPLDARHGDNRAKIFPYSRVRSLKFGSNTRLKSLTFSNSIGGTTALVHGIAVLAIRNGNTFQYRSVFGTAVSTMKKQFNSQKVQECEMEIFINVCRDRIVYTERGFFPNELEAVLVKLQREAVLAMKRIITEKTGLSLPEALRGSTFLEESKKLRALYTEIENNHSELQAVPKDQTQTAIQTASLGRISDGSILSRISQLANGASRSNFLLVPKDDTFFVIGVTSAGSSLTIKLTHFQIKGKRLPVGAFAYSVGSWVLERGGEGASPSIHQILAIFPPLQA